jgi:C1A family cysteine protease/subtilisin-like proprotein convertase family protein
MKMNKFLLGLCLLLASYPVIGTALTVQEVQKAIQMKGESWTAGETSVSRLSPEQKKRLCGALPEPPSVRSRKAAPKGYMVPRDGRSFPSSWDWRNKDGHNWVTPIRNQLSFNTCTAFSTIACLESIMKIQSGNPDLDIDLSERFVFAFGGGKPDKGWWASQVADFLMTVGTVSESDCPYVGWDGTLPTDSPAKYLPDGGAYLIENWEVISDSYVIGDYESPLKSAVMQSPIMCWMDVYEDFLTYTGGVYSAVTGGSVGAHMVALLGWDDDQDYWICKNSWGGGWGEGGFFRLKMSTRGNSNFSMYTYRMLPRTSPPLYYFRNTDGARGIPDGTSFLSSVCVARGIASPVDVTLELFINHPHTQDVQARLLTPWDGGVLVLDKEGGIYPNFDGIFLNDRCSWSISDMIELREYVGLGSYRGCVRPDNSMGTLLLTPPFGEWTLKVEDGVVGQAGMLDSWGVYLATTQATAANPSWVTYY